MLSWTGGRGGEFARKRHTSGRGDRQPKELARVERLRAVPGRADGFADIPVLHGDRDRWAGRAGQDDRRREAAAAHGRRRSGRAAVVPRANTIVSSRPWTSNLRGLLSTDSLPLHLQQPTLPMQSVISAGDPKRTNSSRSVSPLSGRCGSGPL